MLPPVSFFVALGPNEISGRNVWHDGSQFASIKVLNQQTCALIMDDDDVRGYLSADGQEIEWEDGDCWKRAKDAKGFQIQQDGREAQVPVSKAEQHWSNTSKGLEVTYDPKVTDREVLEALLQRNAGSLQRVLDFGHSADKSLEPAPLWQEMAWTPEGCEQTPVPLLVGAILLQWPEAESIFWCVEQFLRTEQTSSKQATIKRHHF